MQEPLPGLPPAAQIDTAAQQWSALAPVLAARGRVRLSYDGGRTYPRRLERALTGQPPPCPAAVHVYCEDGTARLLAGDFDVKRAAARGAVNAAEQVEADAAAFAALIRSCGGRGFGDISPNGGRHGYVLWAAPVPHIEMRRVALALAARYPSLDPSPMLGREHGVIRPPGSRHRSGGIQVLTTPLIDARRCVAAPNGAAVWERLCAALEGELQALESAAAALPAEDTAAAGARVRVDEAGAPWVPRPGGRVARLAPALELAAITGGYDTSRYDSGSSARQAVLDSAAARGWQLPEVTARMDSGEWEGLAAFYAKYSSSYRPTRLAAEWKKAVAHVTSGKTGRLSTTRGILHAPRGDYQSAAGETQGSTDDLAPVTAPTEYQQIRMWHNGIRAAEEDDCWQGKHGLSVRMVLRALGAAAQMTGSMVIEWGTRSLGLHAGLDHSTVSRILVELREEEDPVLDLLADRRGWRGDLYLLRIPARYAEAATWRRWRPGRIGVHPVFRKLGGPPAVLIYEQLTTAPAGVGELARLARLSPTAAGEVLATLAGEGAAVRGPGGWRRGPADLDQLADRLGVPALLASIVAQHRAERQQWRDRLVLCPAPPVRPVRSPTPPTPRTAPARQEIPGEPAAARAPPPEGPPVPDITAAAIAALEADLGAVVILSA